MGMVASAAAEEAPVKVSDSANSLWAQIREVWTAL